MDTVQFFQKMFDKGEASDLNFPDGYLNHRFQSSFCRTKDYASFETKYKNYIKKNLPENFALSSFSTNHFGFSCAIQSDIGETIKLSISDVRFFPNQWFNDIHMRIENGTDKYTNFSRPATVKTLKFDLMKIIQNYLKNLIRRALT